MGDRHLHDQEKQEEKTMIALVDCNNFYASCERAFNPNWNNRPVVVLSNNDGCVIARSNEAKALGIKMGVPAYQSRTRSSGMVLACSHPIIRCMGICPTG